MKSKQFPIMTHNESLYSLIIIILAWCLEINQNYTDKLHTINTVLQLIL